MSKEFCVVIPAYNEERYIKQTISKVKKFCKYIIVVNDGSSDNTIKESKGANKIINLILNSGKGTALRSGCDYAVRKGFKKIVVVDGDGQHDPNEIPLFVNALDDNDIVFGFREFTKQMPLVLRLGNWGLSFATALIQRIKLKDTQCGYRAFTSSAYKRIRWRSPGYSMESEMVARARKEKLKYSEVKVATIYNDKFKGTTAFDGVKVMLDIIKWRFLV